MATHNLTRWGGLISITAGVLGIVYRFSGWTNFLIAGTATGLLFFLLLIVAIQALHATQALESGGLGRLGSVLVTLGAIINIGYLFFSIALFSGIEGARPVLSLFFNTIPLFYIGSPVFDVGLFMFGVATFRASVLSRWAGILLTASAILSFGADIDFVGFLGIGVLILPASILLGIALAWLGRALWSGKRGLTGQAQPAM